MSMINFVIIEVRRRLQALTVFVKLNAPAEILEFKQEKNSVRFTFKEKKTETLKFNFEIIDQSLSSSVLEDSFITFRLGTNNLKNGSQVKGSYKAEILSLTRDFEKVKIIECKIKPKLDYILKCKSCNNHLSKVLNFKRVLPLPNSEQQGWFCHGHAKNIEIHAKPDDLLYSNANFSLPQNKMIENNVSGESTNNETIFSCKTCNSWIGTVKKDNFKVWFNTVKFVDQKENLEISTNPLTDTFNVIKGIFIDNIIRTVKIVFVCNSEKKFKQYLLIWILEKDLELQKLIDLDKEPEILNVSKVSFKINQNDEDSTLKEWLKLSQTYVLDISKGMFEETCKHLQENSELIPETFRKGLDNFRFSYLVD